MAEANVIAEHMEVLGADGVHVGTVDHLDGDRIKLTRTGSDDGQHHYVPKALVQDIRGNTVTLIKTAAEVIGMDASETEGTGHARTGAARARRWRNNHARQ